MEIDERLFEAFSPNQLKDALDEAAEIELPPIRPIFGWPTLALMWKILGSNLLGPMTKLGAALVMVFIFAATTVAPQTQLARDAGIVLCGMRRRARCGRLLHRTSAAYPWRALQVARSAGRTARIVSARRCGST